MQTVPHAHASQAKKWRLQCKWETSTTAINPQMHTAKVKREERQTGLRSVWIWMTYPSPSALSGDGAGAGTETVPTLSSLIWMVLLKGLFRYLRSMFLSSSARCVTAISRGLFARRTMPLSLLSLQFCTRGLCS